jgi:hypothetical protein
VDMLSKTLVYEESNKLDGLLIHSKWGGSWRDEGCLLGYIYIYCADRCIFIVQKDFFRFF